MIAEKSHTAEDLIGKLSGTKVGFIPQQQVSEALTKLSAEGFPNARNEEYKYCNMDAVFRKDFRNVSQKFNERISVDQYRIPGTVMLVMLNGAYSEKHSDSQLPDGVTIARLSGLKTVLPGTLAKPSTDAFIALNTAYAGDGLFICVSENTTASMPLHILYISIAEGEAVINPRTCIEVRRGAALELIEQQVNTGGKIFSNILSERFVRDGAKLNTTLLQDEGPSGFSLNTTIAEAHRDAVYQNATVTVSGQLVRNNHSVILAGNNSTAHLDGLFSVSGTQLVDNHTLMDHQVAHCESNELYKGLASGKGTGVFNGKIYVRRDAQKTNAYQSSKNILLSDDATIDTKPQLEIYADDVKCSHGTSTGKVDEQAMFYLNARGVGKESARKILLLSFAEEVISRITNEALREKVHARFERSMLES